MKVCQSIWTHATGWVDSGPDLPDAHLVLLFGSRGMLADGAKVASVLQRFPAAVVSGCSTAGEISSDGHVRDDSLVATAVRFDSTQVRLSVVRLDETSGSRDAGARVAHELMGSGLVHVLVFSDGLAVNGSDLTSGLRSGLPQGVSITGGLAGDGARFEKTLVVANGETRPGIIAAVGFYGDRLCVGSGSLGGWDPFGPDRIITRASGNVLYELDGQPALALYRRYLGEYAKDLPSSGLLFPLLVRPAEGESGVVRTLLGINEREQSVTFAGDMPQGSLARLMKANFDRLIDGATGAARINADALGARPAQLGVLISCVGRKLVLRQRVEEEIEAVREVLGLSPVLSGFYSYGEIAPFMPGAPCDLHNQTMTITTMAES